MLRFPVVSSGGGSSSSNSSRVDKSSPSSSRRSEQPWFYNSNPPYRIVHPPPSKESNYGSVPPPGLTRKVKSIVHLLYDRQRGGNSRRAGSACFLPRVYYQTNSNTSSCQQETISNQNHLNSTTADDPTMPQQLPIGDHRHHHRNPPKQRRSSYSHQIFPTFSTPSRTQIAQYAEYASVTRFHSSYLPLQPNTVSTISIAFSADGSLLASTHGDHTVKVSCCYSGRLLSVCTGHSRTPWTVKFHPTQPNLIASGCLGFQVRIWNIGLNSNNYSSASAESQQPQQAICLYFIRLQFAIISLSFHPFVDLLVIASGQSLHLWDFTQMGAVTRVNKSRSSTPTTSNRAGSTNNAATARNSYQQVVEWKHPEALRCVNFTPDGKSFIIGGVNPQLPEDEPLGATFSLRLWDFNVADALPSSSNNGHLDMERASSNPRVFVSRALLYNDGGFDLSPCGKFLVCCADIWLPFRMNNAMELYSIEEQLKGNTQHDEDSDYFEEIEDTSTALLTLHSNTSHDKEDDEELLLDTHDANSDKTTTMNASSPPQRNRQQHQNSMPHERTTNSDALMNISPLLQQRPAAFATSNNTFIASTPQTPPSLQPRIALSPPSPPGRRFGRYSNESNFLLVNARVERGQNSTNNHSRGGPVTHNIPRRDTAPGVLHTLLLRTSSATGGDREDVRNRRGGASNSLSSIELHSGTNHDTPPVPFGGRYVPHVVLVKLPQKSNNCTGTQLQQQDVVLHAAPLERSTASGVTCVKFSPSASYCLLGYGVRETHARDGEPHRVTALYQIEGMHSIATLTSTRDDVNIARFHPVSGHGFVYGTKQGRVRVLSCKPWCKSTSDSNNFPL